MSTTTIHSELTALEKRLAAAGVNVHAPVAVPEPQAAPLQPQPARQAPAFNTGAPAGHRDPQATQRQIDLIQRLARERGVTHTEGGKLIAGLSIETPGFTNHRVSQVLDFIRSHSVRSSVRRNQRPQACAECGVEVLAGEGVLTNEGGWVVRHEGECPEVLTEEEIERARIREIELVDPALSIAGLMGKYADPDQEIGEGNLLVQVSEHPTIEGALVVRDENPYGYHAEYGVQLPGETYRGKVADHLRTIVSDPLGAMASFGFKTNACGNCGRPLRDKGHAGPDGLTSVERGIGPICAKNLGMFA